MEQVVKQGQKINVTIKRLGINGEGIAYFLRPLVFFMIVVAAASCNIWLMTNN